MIQVHNKKHQPTIEETDGWNKKTQWESEGVKVTAKQDLKTNMDN